MLKLYKEIDGRLHYWETWDEDEGRSFIHWGIVGQLGDTNIVTPENTPNYKQAIQDEITEKKVEGFKEVEKEKMMYLEIEYRIEGDGFGRLDDLDKRHRLERRLDEILGWTGLGHVDGGSIGGGTMEVGCLVVDFAIAKKVVETVLKHTEFNNYSRIFILGG